MIRFISILMRFVSDLFERYGVDIVFAGHYHDYRRRYPVKFVLDTAAWLTRPRQVGPSLGHIAVPGHFVIDRTFDGNVRTWSDGVIYVVTGAGGAPREAVGIHISEGLAVGLHEVGRTS